MHGYFAIGTAGPLADHQSVIAVALNLLAFQAERQVAIRRASRLLRSAIVQLLIGGLHATQRRRRPGRVSTSRTVRSESPYSYPMTRSPV